MAKLFLYTATYPFGNAETFLEDEIGFLAKGFDEVYIQPLSGRSNSKVHRPVPPNCKIGTPIIYSRKWQYINLLKPTQAWGVYIKEFFEKKVFLSLSRFKTWLVSFSLTNNLLLSKQVKDIFDSVEKSDICYFYWGKGSNTMAYFYRGRAKFVSRFHGEWDLWEESSGNYAPLREQINCSLTRALFISQKGEKYYHLRYPDVKTEICRLGSIDNGQCKKSSDKVFRVISCSTVYPLKRVDLIFESLFRANDIYIEWTHLGGGQDFEKLKNIVDSKKRGGFIVNLWGQVSHDEVLNYYKNHEVDLFINLSTNEGIPVSIMEAISFDVPAIATNVGASSEVVVEGVSGILVSPNPSPEEVVNAVRRIHSNTLSLNPRQFWEKEYDAKNNYNRIVQLLKSL